MVLGECPQTVHRKVTITPHLAVFSEQVTLEQTRAAGIVQYVCYCSKCIPYSVALPQIRGFFRELEVSSSVSQKTFPEANGCTQQKASS